ncbi:hypothetical protein FLM52_05390 [bacterium Scap17]|nr:hypothetical protein [bacterium Scap17]
MDWELVVENNRAYTCVSLIILVACMVFLYWVYDKADVSNSQDIKEIFYVLCAFVALVTLSTAVSLINRDWISGWPAKMFSTFIGLIVTLVLMLLESAGLISLKIAPIFYTGMMTMALGMIATIFTVYNRVPSNNANTSSVMNHWNRKLKVSIFLPLLLMLFSGYGLLGINDAIDFFPAFLPSLAIGVAFAAWLYVTDFTMAVIDLNTCSD